MRISGLVWCVVVAVCLAIPGANPASGHPPAILNEAGERLVREEITAFRKELARAIGVRNAARLRWMYVPSFAHTHPSGKIDDRAARLKTLLSGEPVIETAAVEDLIIRVPNDWVAIATGRSLIRAATEGQPAEIVRWTAVYTRAGQSWVVAASHETRLLENGAK